MIQFGFQLGGGNSREKIQPLHVLLNKVFNQEKGMYFEGIKKFSIYYRVSGKLTDFGEEGTGLIELDESKKILSIEFIVPEKVWKTYQNSELIDYFRDSVEDSFLKLVNYSTEKGYLKDKDNIVLHFYTKLEDFKKQ